MNFAGRPLLSRSTQATGRSLWLLSLATVLTVSLDIDTSQMSVFDVPISEDQLGTATLWSLFVLLVALVVNWTGDFVSLGKWNSFMSEKRVETVWDGGSKIKGRVEFVLDSLESAASDTTNENLDDAKLDHVTGVFKELESGLWKYEVTAVCYVAIWGFLAPMVIAVWAIYLVSNA
ncbi:hypothetical protein ROLI_018290 [Roseobacter fucihabitans]|uniref:Uncharacterized protein n=1 Tax=Roseobacter fucihabitans TaxID=1537242 RepID=A0ABZ2BSR3_9RHOB|nr:hypothetical protein [Roseobacter litoralis]MBC6965588.1 hypothetical protein [Roseobacter litoralis]